MKPNINHLITELYSADPSLKEHEKVLKPILKELIAARPNVAIDKQFKAKLHEEVWEQIEAVQQNPGRFSFPKWAYAFGGAALTAIIIVPAFLVNFSGNVDTMGEEPLNYEGKGGGGMRATSDAIEEDEDYAAMIYPGDYSYTTFTYAYQGDTIELDENPVEIFTHKIFDNTATQVNNWLDDLDLGLIDLGAFEEFKMSYLTIEPEDDVGYSVNFDYANSMISLSYWDANSWEREWDYSSSGKTMSTTEALQIAEDFIQKHNLDLSDFGDPLVDGQEVYDGYVQSYMTVIYPIEQNGLTLYGSWGSPEGITITISIDDERVDSLWGLSPQNYQASYYDPITDETLVIETAEQGGYNGYIDLYADNVVELDLGTPFEGLTKIYDYDGDEYLERLVPALIFPVTEYHEDNYTDYIVVPLVEEFLGDEYPDTPVQIMEEEAVG